MVVEYLFQESLRLDTFASWYLCRGDWVDIYDCWALALAFGPVVLRVEDVLAGLGVLYLEEVVSKAFGWSCLHVLVARTSLVPLAEGCKVSGVAFLCGSSFVGLGDGDGEELGLGVPDFELEELGGEVFELRLDKVVMCVIIEFADIY